MVRMVPPSTTISAPRMLAAVSDARNAMTPSDFVRGGEASQRHAAQGGEERVPGGIAVAVEALGEPVDEVVRALRSNAARRDGVDADAVRGELPGQTLAVGTQGRFGRRVRQGAVPQRHARLDRRHVDDRAPAPLDHRRNQLAVQAHRGQQVQVELLRPFRLSQGTEASGR